MKDKEFLQWIHDRLVNRYGESPNTDFVLRLQEIVDGTPPNQRIRRTFSDGKG
jgi:hypothetical protein